MLDFYDKVSAALEGQGGALVSIVAASGSAPRGIGAKMLVRADGTATGTIGGGAVEHAAQLLASEAIEQRRSLIREYDLSPSQSSTLGMVCGGSITVSIHYLNPESKADRALYGCISNCVRQPRPCTLVTQVGEEGCLHYLDAQSSPSPLPAQVAAAITPGCQELTVDGLHYVVEPLVTGERVLVFGAGHVGRELSYFLHRLGLYHLILDDRGEFLTKENLPLADGRREAAFGEVITSLDVTGQDYVVIMTRGHLHDYTVLRDALSTPARYIGMIGSRAKVATTLEKLRNEGFSEEDIARVHAPIGLPLGGKTPEEVALSVCAQLVRVRNGMED